MVNRTLALLLMVALTLPACAATTAPRLQTAAAPAVTAPDRALMAEYVQRLPVGSRVRVHLVDGRRERGTLMDANAGRIVIHPRTRIPEPPREIPLERVLGVDLDNGNGSVARAVGIGIASGVGSFFGLMLLFAALYAD